MCVRVKLQSREKDILFIILLNYCFMSLAGGRIDQHTVRRSSSERVSVLEARQVTDDGPIAAPVLAHGN